MAFELDTSGAVACIPPIERDGRLVTAVGWSDLSPFTQGYIEALAASQIVGGAHVGCLETAHGTLHEIAFSDLAPETLARIVADCEAARETGAYPNRTWGGGAFWTNRQRGDLTDFPPLTAQLGDDGKVRFAAPAVQERRAGA